ncbi:MAG TPA: DEAD/DEAH box helicase family protein [Armatimonadota bacterium]|nr:DEAD/DEAH box helicase family protein [Armatimonadota bacterium]
MRQRASDDAFAQLHLARELAGDIEGWSKQGWPGVTQTTHDLLSYWFNRDPDSGECFYLCQQRAIETVIYCHEALQEPTLARLYQRVAPEALLQFQALKAEVQNIPFSKYCLKMATGSGKTWVLAALLIWQYFNALRRERPGVYSGRFLVVTPGHEVLNRLLDSFKGKRDRKTGLRNPETSDYRRELFIPPGAMWQDQFHIEILEPSDVRPNTTPPDGPFVFLTNWQQFRLKPPEGSLWDRLTGADVEEQSRGEIIADFLSEFPDLVVMNDEAHHVHGKKPRGSRVSQSDELVWRQFMGVLYDRLTEAHGDERGLFMQLDFSATPFFGSGPEREYFPHIVYDYALLEAMNHMLVKQLFLEERQAIGGERLEELDFRAERTEPESGRRRGQVTGLSPGQKLLLDIGRRKMEQLAEELRQRGIDKKPVMLVLAEETEVAGLVVNHFATLTDERGNTYGKRDVVNDDGQGQVLLIHSGLPDKELDGARRCLDAIDVDADPLRVVISVLMLREGFDKMNICVIVVLRATEADLLLEQIVGRGLRLMFPPASHPEFQDAKREAYQQIRLGRIPANSLDFLFIVEHPRFRAFYDQLRREGYIIGEGDTSRVTTTGDIIPVEAIPTRIPSHDIAWPVQIFEQGRLPDLRQLDISALPAYPGDFASLKQMLGKLAISDVHVPSDKRTRTWKLDNPYFDYNFFLSQASRAIAREGKVQLLTGKLAEIAEVVDEYAARHLFRQEIDFTAPEDYQVLNFTLVFDHVVNQVRTAILRAAEKAQFEVRQGIWKRLSQVPRIMVRESHSVATDRSIYPRLPYSAVGGGFEKDFMLETLNTSPDLAYAKLDRKHGLRIPYRDTDAIYREYEVDFIVREADAIYLVETKADRDLDSPTVAIKARAAQAWCDTASTVRAPDDLPQPSKWEYVILSESLFKQNRGLSFQGLVPQCRALRDRLIAQAEGALFVIGEEAAPYGE